MRIYRTHVRFVIGLLAFLLAGAATAQAGAGCSDLDGDGFFGSPGCGTALDCDDMRPDVHPEAVEACNGIDDDCSGTPDDDPACSQACSTLEPGLLREEAVLDGSYELSWTGDQYVLASFSDPSMAVRSYDRNARFLGQFAAQSGTFGFGLNGSRSASVFVSTHLFGSDLFFTLAGPGLPTTSNYLVIDHPCDVLGGDVAWGGNGWGVTWWTCDQWIYFDRLSPEGYRTAPRLRLTTIGAHPQLVWTGTEFAVFMALGVDNFFTEIGLARISATGELLEGPVPITQGAKVENFSVTRHGTGFGLVWQDRRGPAYARTIRFIGLDAQGTPVTEERALTSMETDSRVPDIVSTGAEFGVAWGESLAGNPGRHHFARVDSQGQIVASWSFQSLSRPRLAWTGEEYGMASTVAGTPSLTVIGCCTRDDDGDGFLSCEECADLDSETFPGAPEICGDGVNNDCDSLGWPFSDVDRDGVDTACDNCPGTANPRQDDVDADGEGDVCDVDDGIVHLYWGDKQFVRWSDDEGFDRWNFYSGDLAVLRATGVYSQAPGSNPLASRQCGGGGSTPYALDTVAPAGGQTAFYLAAGALGANIDDLGTDSAGVSREHANPCPIPGR